MILVELENYFPFLSFPFGIVEIVPKFVQIYAIQCEKYVPITFRADASTFTFRWKNDDNFK